LTHASSEEVVLIVEKVGEGVPASEEVPEDVLGRLHVEVVEVCIMEVVLAAPSAATRMASVYHIVPSVGVVHFSLFLVAHNAVGEGYDFEDRLGLLLIIGVLVRVVLQRQLSVRLLDLVLVSAPLHAQVFVEVLAIEVGLAH